MRKQLHLFFYVLIFIAGHVSAQTITTLGVITNLCAGGTLSVNYTITGTFNSDNTFIAQLSDSSGSFVSPVEIGEISSVSAGTISATIPTTTVAGKDYRIRVNGTDPAITGSTNGSNIVVNNPAAPTGLATQSFCNGASPTVADLSATGTDIQWYLYPGSINPFSPSYPLIDEFYNNGGYFYATQTINGCQSLSTLQVLAIIFNTTPAPSGPVSQSFCNSGTVANLVATGNDIQWYATPTGGNPLASSTALVNGTPYFASQTVADCGESTSRLDVTAAVFSSTPAPTGAATQSFCSADSPTLDSLVVTAVDIKWYAAATGGTTLPGPTVLQNGTTYYASQTFNGCGESHSRLAVTAMVYSTVPAPTGPVSQEFCAGNVPEIDSLIAYGTSIQWYSASSGGAPLNPTQTLTNGTYYASQSIGGCESPSRLAVAVSLDSIAAPTGLAAQSFYNCALPTIADLSATGTGIQWYQYPGSTTPLSPSAYLYEYNGGNGNFYATQTIGGCRSLATLNVTTTFFYNAPSPAGPAYQPFCNSATVANLVATGTDVQWYATASGGTPLPSSAALVNGSQYYASETVPGCGESSVRLNVTAAVFSSTPAPSGAATQSFCSADSPTLDSLVVTGNGIKWYSAATGGNLLSGSTVLNNLTTYYASQTVSGCGESQSRLAVTAIVYEVTPPPTGSATQLFCAGNYPGIDSLKAYGSAIQWYSSPTGGTPLYSYQALTNAMYYASQSIGACGESPSRLSVSVSLDSVASPTGPMYQSFCAGSLPTVADLTAFGTDIQWYSYGSLLPPSYPIYDGDYFYATQTVGGCKSAGVLEVSASTFTSTSPPMGPVSQIFCNSATVANLVATGNDVQWYSVPAGGNPLASSVPVVTGTRYYASQTIGGCGESQPRLGVSVDVFTSTPAPSGAATQSFCSSSLPSLDSIVVEGTAITWYASATGGTPLPGSTALHSGTTYYASQSIGACGESQSRLAVKTILYLTTPAPSGPASQSFCSGANPEIDSLVAFGRAIQWYSDSTGGYTYDPSQSLTNGTVYYASQSVGACGESPARLPVAVTVNSTSAPSGSDYQSFCPGATLADISIEGTDIQWYPYPGNNTLLPPSTVLDSGSSYYATQTISGCASSTNLEVTVSVYSATPAPVGAPTQIFCSASPPVVASLYAIGNDVQWYSVPTGGVPLSFGTELVSGDHYYATQTNNGCESNVRLDVTAVIFSTTPAPTGATSQSFCSASSPVLDSLVVQGVDIKWYSAATGGNLLSGSVLLQSGATYYASQTFGGCGESPTRLPVTVTLFNSTPAPSGPASQTFCYGNNPTITNLQVTGTSVQWYSLPVGGLPLDSIRILTSRTYYASQTFGGCGESPSRLAVAVTVDSVAAPTGSTTQSFCAFSSPTIADLSANGSDVQWFYNPSPEISVSGNGSGTGAGVQGLQGPDDLEGGSFLPPSSPLTNGTYYYATQTVGGCVSSATLPVYVLFFNSTPAPTGTASQSFCASSSATVSDLVATGNAIQWYTDSTGGIALAPTTILATGTTYYASQTDSGCGESPERLPVTVTLYSATPTPTGSATQSFCSLDLPVIDSLSANGTAIRWYLSPTGGSSLSGSSALQSGTTYYASQTSGSCGESQTRLVVTATLFSTTPAPSGPASQTFCYSSYPELDSLTAYGSAIQWYGTASGGTPLYSYGPLVNGSIYYASQRVGACGESPTRLAVTVTVDSVPAPTGPATQSFCSYNATPIADLIATGTGIQWFNYPGGTPISPSDFVGDQIYYGTQTINGCRSASTLQVKATSFSVTPAPTGQTSQFFCSGASPEIDNLSASGNAIQWYADTSGGIALPPLTALVSGTTYYASQTDSGCGESPGRLAVTADFYSITPAPTGPAAQAFCVNSAPAIDSLAVTGTSIKWYLNPTGGTALSGSVALQTGTTYYASQTVGGCGESPSRLAVAVTIYSATPAPTGPALQKFCYPMNPEIDSLIAYGKSVQWYNSPGGGSPLPSDLVLANATVYYASQTVKGCGESPARLAVSVTVDSVPAPTGPALQTFCSFTSPTVADLAATGSNILWYAFTGGSDPLPPSALLNTENNIYYGYIAYQSVNGCSSPEYLEVHIGLFNNTPAPSGPVSQAFCSGASPTVSDLAATGNAIQWYADSTGGIALAPAAALVNGTIYYASQTESGCGESPERLAVTVTDYAATPPPTGPASQNFCASTGPTLDSLTVTGTAIKWYSTPTGGTVISGSESLQNGTTYYASQTVGGCGESQSRLAVTVTVTTTPAPTGNSSQTFCNEATVADLTSTGSDVVWYSSASGGSKLSGITVLVNNTSYFASQTIAGCESSARFETDVTINLTPPPTGYVYQSFCASTGPTVDSLTVTGTAIRWYSTPAGGSAIPGSELLQNGTTYYASQTLADCESSTRLPVSVNVYAATPAPTGPAIQTFCSVSSPTIADLTVTGTNIAWYSAPTGGNPLTLTTALVNGVSYYASQDVQGCGVSTSRLDVTATLNPLPDSATNVNGNIITAVQNGASYQWLNCDENYSIIPGSTNQSYTANSSGDYAVRITLQGCTDTSSCVSVLSTGVEKYTGSNKVLLVYPNPNNGVFSIQATHEGLYTIMDGLGQVVQRFICNSANQYKVNVDNLGSGVYFVVGMDNNQASWQKVVILK